MKKMFLLLALVAVTVLGNGCVAFVEDGPYYGGPYSEVYVGPPVIYTEPVLIGPSIWFWGGQRYHYAPYYHPQYHRFGYGSGYSEHREFHPQRRTPNYPPSGGHPGGPGGHRR